MSEYNQYVTAINKIFNYLTKMKAGWDNSDNLSYIESIEEYKEIVINSVELFKNTSIPKVKKDDLEALGDD